MVNIDGFSSDGFADSDRSVVCTAETAECGCPERCDRDHSNE
jgi:hypothetical protein